MSNLQSYKINKAIHPGKTLKETLEVLNISQKELSNKTGLTVKHISNIVNEKASVTPETALKFENILGISADFWNSLEKNYQATLAKIEHKEHILIESKNIEEYRETYKELVDKELIEKLIFNSVNLQNITENLLKYFKVFSFSSVLGTEEVVFRRYNNSTVNYKTVEAVIRAGEKKAKRVETKPFNEEKLKNSLEDIKKLSKGKYSEYMPKIDKILKDVGVVLVAIPGFKKTGIQGISKWLSNDKVMIILKTDGQVKGTSQYEDILFFNLFHEIGHILLHSKKKTFLDLEDRVDSKEEREADQFASDVLIPGFKKEKDLQEYKKGNSISAEKAVTGLSKRYEISEAIIAGQLSYLFREQPSIYKILSKYKNKVNYRNYLD